jgi:hypothetical protein
LAFPAVYGRPKQKQIVEFRKRIDSHEWYLEREPGYFPELENERQSLLSRLSPNQNTSEFEELIVIVHPESKRFETKITKALSDFADFQNVPRLLLASEEFPLRSQLLLSQVSMLQYSPGGNFITATPLAKKVHMLGGYSFSCLARAGRDLIWKAMGAGLSEMTFYYRSRFLYYEVDSKDEIDDVDWRIFTSPWIFAPKYVAKRLVEDSLNSENFDEPKPLQISSLTSELRKDRVWEGTFSPKAAPQFTIRIVIDPN